MKKYIIYLIIIILFITISGCKDKIYQYELVAIKNSSGIQGNFFLGSGSIDAEQYFFAYIKYEDGGIMLWKCNRCVTTIYEDIKENEIPCVVLIEDWQGAQSYQFHVPENSILQNFNLN